MAIRKNKKRIDPRYFLNETTFRDSLETDDPIWRGYSMGTADFHLHLATRRRTSERQEIWDAAVAGGDWAMAVKDLREFYAENPELLMKELDPGLK
tara:strand:- start:424 stop:711 length:288 start_codon:yes stop_codon:yes gene_type:complete